jgi:hypothetical protein
VGEPQSKAAKPSLGSVIAPQRAQRALGPGLVSRAAATARGAGHLWHEIYDDIQVGVLGRSVEYLGETGA